jgi:hypothetical protein
VVIANTKRDNIPVPAALLLLGGVVWVLIAGPNLTSLTDLGDQVESFMDRNGPLVLLSVVLVFFNAFSVATYITKFWSYKKQGSRLRDLTGERQHDAKGLWTLTYIVVSITILYSCVLWIATHLFGVVLSPDALPDAVIVVGIVNTSLAAAIMTHWARDVLRQMARANATKRGLTDIPKARDSIAIGSAFPDDESQVEEWVVLNKKALCGNILITGSIGSGKTQGTRLFPEPGALGNIKLVSYCEAVRPPPRGPLRKDRLSRLGVLILAKTT